MVWSLIWYISTCDIYFGYFKKTVRKLASMLLLTIDKYFTTCTCSKQSQWLKGLMLVIYQTSKMSLQSPDFLTYFV